MSTANPSVPVNVGDVLLGKYVVERVIGAGGMGVVVAVRHRDLGELYAMKFMLPAALANEQAVDRFVREARAAAKLKSEHVAKVHDVGRLENGSPYMVMEHLVGQDLEAVLATHGPLTPAVAATYVMQACDAIAEAHDAGVVHRDLKPANLFLTKRANGSPCIKVLDFGISKSINPDEAANSMTRTTAIMGSPYYMSPEQMRSSKNVDHRTDIWALGVILYQLTTGRVPFPGETITEVCSGVLADDPPPLVSQLHGIPQEFDTIVRRCLQKQSGHRFGNARELAQTLAPVAGPSPGTSGLNLDAIAAMGAGGRASNPSLASYDPRASAPHGMSRSGPEHAYGVKGATVIAEPLAGSTTGPHQTQSQWGSTQPTTKKKGAALPVIAGLLVVGALGAAGFVMFGGKNQTSEANAATSQPNSKASTAETATTVVTATATATAAAPPVETTKPVETAATATESATSTATVETTSKVAVGIAPKPTAVKPKTATPPTATAPKATAAPTPTGRSIF
ncbi:MAG: serine/threonine protein kinase [Polyangiaceae bacterium]|nr:serine/threonine protein kinase [Polyangiaceae bacterium]